MNPRIYEKIADEIEVMIQRDNLVILPTIIALSEKWGVAYQTMWKAIALLAKKGVVRIRRGKRIVVAKPGDSVGASEAGSVWSSSTDRVYAVIRDRLLSGIYQSRQPLPKAEFLASSEGVSRITVLRLFHRLEEEGLAHRSRRRWIVGPQHRAETSRVIKLSSNNSPVVCMFGADKFDWYEHFNSPFTRQFMSIFASEIMNHGCQLRHLNRSQKDSRHSPGIPTPFSEIKSVINKLGTRYAGSVLLSAFPVEENLGEWISWLSQFHKPVVFFDHTDKGASIDHHLAAPRIPCYRLHLNERDGIGLALDELAKLGHRKIGVHYSSRIDWHVRRLDLIRQCAGSMNPTVDIVARAWTPSEDEIFLQAISPDPNQFALRIKKQAGVSTERETAGGPAARMYRGLLIKNSESLWELVGKRDATALISVNDFLAFNHYAWCESAGIKIPSDVSLVSFDNLQVSNILPIATVDWGFARLGYLAAHIFIGDIPVGSGRKRALGGQCLLFDRGSLARPRRRTA